MAVQELIVNKSEFRDMMKKSLWIVALILLSACSDVPEISMPDLLLIRADAIKLLEANKGFKLRNDLSAYKALGKLDI